jgi:hypothetical protein
MQEQVVDVLGNVERPLVLAGRSEQRDDEPTGPGDVVEVVCEPRLQPVQILHPRLEEGKNGFRDETPDTIAIHHQQRPPLAGGAGPPPPTVTLYPLPPPPPARWSCRPRSRPSPLCCSH